LKKRIRKILYSERGEADYISSVVHILVVVILVMFIINVFRIITAKQQMDMIADQIVKQIQLSGGTSTETVALFRHMSAQLSDVENLTYDVDCTSSTSKIQIGTPFYVTVTGTCYLGGIWEFDLAPIHLKAQGAGVSEHYWK